MEKEVKNAIVIDGEIYDIVPVEDHINFCVKCALREQCDQIEPRGYLCDLVFPDLPTSYFVKREDK